MMTRLVQCGCVFLSVILISCTSVNTVAKDVMGELVRLLDSGKLPGMTASDQIEEAHVQDFPAYYRIKYPASVAVFITKKDEASVYSYVFTKVDAKDEWTLTSAGKRLQNGEREILK